MAQGKEYSLLSAETRDQMFVEMYADIKSIYTKIENTERIIQKHETVLFGESGRNGLIGRVNDCEDMIDSLTTDHKQKMCSILSNKKYNTATVISVCSVILSALTIILGAIVLFK